MVREKKDYAANGVLIARRMTETKKETEILVGLICSLRIVHLCKVYSLSVTEKRSMIFTLCDRLVSTVGVKLGVGSIFF